MTIFEQIISKISLINGFHRVKENEGGPGFDNQTIEQFEENLEDNIRLLNYELTQKKYKLLPVILFEKKKENGKSRILSVFSIRDRIVQSSAFIVLYPIFDNEFESSSFGFRVGKSREDAARKIYSYYNDGYRWILEADIKYFFDSVNHSVIIRKLENLIKDPSVVSLLKKNIAPDCIINNKKKKINSGLLQGSVLSPLLANLYLDEFDEKMRDNGFKLVRYADDFLILAKEKPKAEKALEFSKQLLKEINLELNMEKTSVVSFEQGFKYLGYIFLNALIVPGSPKDTSFPCSDQKKYTLSDDALATIKKLTKPDIPKPKPVTATSLNATEIGSAFVEALKEKGTTVEDFLKSLDGNVKPLEDNFENEIKVAFEKKTENYVDTANQVADEEYVVPTQLTAFNRTLYIHENGGYVKKEGNRLIIEKDGTEILEIPIMKIASIIIFGNSIVTPAVIQFALKNRIPISLLSATGKYFGTIESTFSNNIDTERIQLLRSLDKEFALQFTKTVVKTKLNNQRILLMRYKRTKENATLEKRISYIKKVLNRVDKTNELEDVRGLEGVAASAYFNVFGTLFTFESGFFTERFKRTKHPPLDPINSLLSFGYTLLHSNIYSFLKANGLNPYCGVFHAVKSGHPALASDLIEEFRFLIDMLVLYLLNHKVLSKKDFYFDKEPGTPCYLTPHARKIFIKHFEYKMHQRVKHKQTGFSVDYRRCLNLQVQQFAQFIKGNLPEYFPTKLDT